MATSFFLKRLYVLQTPSEKPLSDKVTKADRNAEIRRRYAEGESIPDLAKAFGLSNARVHQIIHGRRK